MSQQTATTGSTSGCGAFERTASDQDGGLRHRSKAAGSKLRATQCTIPNLHAKVNVSIAFTVPGAIREDEVQIRSHCSIYSVSTIDAR
jgi:hypothetical protein